MTNMSRDYINACKEKNIELDEREKACYLDIIERAFRVFIALFITYQFIILRIFNSLDLDMESKLNFYINDLANINILFIGVLSYYVAYALIKSYVNAYKVITYAFIGSAFLALFASSFFEDYFSGIILAIITIITGLLLYILLDLFYKKKMK